VQAIASQTLRRTQSPADFVESFNGRIRALARAHGLLSGGSFQGANVEDLVRDQLLLGSEDSRISWSGAPHVLEAQAALHLALVLHELGANARKYGALSTPAGHVVVQWESKAQDDARRLKLHWREMGGPPVETPSSHGFGSVLIENSLKAHGGEVAVHYEQSGVICEITLPLMEIEQTLPFAFRATAAPQPAGAHTNLRGKRILVVEDEPVIGMVLSDYLADEGCEAVGPAQTVDRAKDLASREAIDAALVDGNLAGQRVDEIVRELNARAIPFAFVTGYGRDTLPAGCKDAPIVEKPFTQEQVIGVLRRLLAPL
jgi:two-component sensor histidine kinase/CheY-like chemotaxis protein